MSFLSGLVEKGEDGFSPLGKLWRGAATELTQGTVDFLGISQHNRDIKDAGGSTFKALLSGIMSGVVAGQESYLADKGKAVTTTDALRGGAIRQYVKMYLPWVIIGVGAMTTALVFIFKGKRR